MCVFMNMQDAKHNFFTCNIYEYKQCIISTALRGYRHITILLFLTEKPFYQLSCQPYYVEEFGEYVWKWDLECFSTTINRINFLLKIINTCNHHIQICTGKFIFRSYNILKGKKLYNESLQNLTASSFQCMN